MFFKAFLGILLTIGDPFFFSCKWVSHQQKGHFQSNMEYPNLKLEKM